MFNFQEVTQGKVSSLKPEITLSNNNGFTFTNGAKSLIGYKDNGDNEEKHNGVKVFVDAKNKVIAVQAVTDGTGKPLTGKLENTFTNKIAGESVKSALGENVKILEHIQAPEAEANGLYVFKAAEATVVEPTSTQQETVEEEEAVEENSQEVEEVDNF